MARSPKQIKKPAPKPTRKVVPIKKAIKARDKAAKKAVELFPNDLVSNDLRLVLSLNRKDIATHPAIASFMQVMEDSLNSNPQVKTQLLAIVGSILIGQTLEAAAPVPTADGGDLV